MPSFPRAVWHVPNFSPANPYQDLLASALGRRGIRAILRESLPGPDEWRLPGAPRVIHLHWVHPFFLAPEGRDPWRWLAGWGRWLLRARAAGIRLVWTVHQVRDHERRSPVCDWIGTCITARLVHRCIVHNRASAEALRRVTGRWRGVEVIPHGHYADVYPRGLHRSEVRREWGVPEDAFAVLFVGALRRYKGVERLIAAFRNAGGPGSRLILAGAPLDDGIRTEVSAAVAGDSRIIVRFGFVPALQLRETVEAADVVVLPFESQISSGSAILALSCGRPVLVPDLPSFREIRRWPGVRTFSPGRAGSLERALREQRDSPPPNPDAIVRAVRGWDWDRIAGATALCYGIDPGVDIRGSA